MFGFENQEAQVEQSYLCNLKLQGDVLKENKELLAFQNEANRIIKNGIYYDDKANIVTGKQIGRASCRERV